MFVFISENILSLLQALLKYLRAPIHYCAHICAFRLEKNPNISRLYNHILLYKNPLNCKAYSCRKEVGKIQLCQVKRWRISRSVLLQENFPALLFTHCKIKAQLQSTTIKFRGINYTKTRSKARNPSRGRSELRAESRHGTGKCPR